MKHTVSKLAFLIPILVKLFLPTFAFAQDGVPEGISYQALARDAKGLPLVNTNIVLEVSILEDNSAGPIIWQETHLVRTNDFGLFDVVIGEGLPTGIGSSGDFASIDWAAGDEYYIRVRADFGTSDFVNGMVEFGAPMRFNSVPFAFVADYAYASPTPSLDKILSEKHGVGSFSKNYTIYYDGTGWTAGTGFLSADGTTNLSGDWSINGHDITFTNGSLTTNQDVKAGSLVFTDFFIYQKSPSQFIIFTALNDSADLGNNAKTIPSEYVIRKEFDKTWLRSGSQLYNSDPLIKVGIGNSNPLYKLHISLAGDLFYVDGQAADMVFSGATGNLNIAKDSRTYLQYENGKLKSGLFNPGYGALADYCTLFGVDNTSSGVESFAAGRECAVSGVNSVALGYQNTAAGQGSLALGVGLTSPYFGQTTVGMYNDYQYSYTVAPPPVKPSTAGLWAALDSAFLFVIGNGNDDNANGTIEANERSNALTVLNNGFAGVGTYNFVSASKKMGERIPVSTFEINGSKAWKTTSGTIGRQLTSLDNVVLVELSNQTFTLPAASSCPGRVYTVKNTGTATNTTLSAGSGTIDGAATRTIAAAYNFLTVISNGTEWFIIGNN